MILRIENVKAVEVCDVTKEVASTAYAKSNFAGITWISRPMRWNLPARGPVLLEQVPLQVNIPEMLTHWKWFGEWSIGCIGILSDWVVETASTLGLAGETVLTLEALAKHALKPAQRLKLETEARDFRVQDRSGEERKRTRASASLGQAINCTDERVATSPIARWCADFSFARARSRILPH
jgi:hypothetical protein